MCHIRCFFSWVFVGCVGEDAFGGCFFLNKAFCSWKVSFYSPCFAFLVWHMRHSGWFGFVTFPGVDTTTETDETFSLLNFRREDQERIFFVKLCLLFTCSVGCSLLCSLWGCVWIPKLWSVITYWNVILKEVGMCGSPAGLCLIQRRCLFSDSYVCRVQKNTSILFRIVIVSILA